MSMIRQVWSWNYAVLDKFLVFQDDPKIAFKICPTSLIVVYVAKIDRGKYCGPVRDLSRESRCCGRFGEAINLLSPAGMEPQFVDCTASSRVPVRPAVFQLLTCLYAQLKWYQNVVQMIKKIKCSYVTYVFSVSGIPHLTHHPSEYVGYYVCGPPSWTWKTLHFMNRLCSWFLLILTINDDYFPVQDKSLCLKG
jgi:hypothetical protein